MKENPKNTFSCFARHREGEEKGRKQIEKLQRAVLIAIYGRFAIKWIEKVPSSNNEVGQTNNEIEYQTKEKTALIHVKRQNIAGL